MVREYQDEELKYLENTLVNYYILKRREQYILREVMKLDIEIDDERKASGISYDGISGTNNNTDTPYINCLINEKVGYEKEAENVKKSYESLDHINQLERRLSKLNTKDKITIYAICKKRTSVADYAKDEKVSRQAIYDRLRKALTKMLEVE